MPVFTGFSKGKKKKAKLISGIIPVEHAGASETLEIWGREKRKEGVKKIARGRRERSVKE